jgi:hypothetical protein
MLTIKEWMELVDYRITEGSDFQWDCYGRRVYVLDSWNGEQDGYSFSIVFSTEDQTVYEVSVCDYTNDRAYRMINEDFQKKMRKEAKRRDVDKDQAWDDVAYVDLDVADDFIQKALAIKNGEEYDTRVSINLDIPDDELLTIFKAAHAMDLTFNEFVEQACIAVIKEHGGEIDD